MSQSNRFRIIAINVPSIPDSMIEENCTKAKVVYQKPVAGERDMLLKRLAIVSSRVDVVLPIVCGNDHPDLFWRHFLSKRQFKVCLDEKCMMFIERLVVAENIKCRLDVTLSFPAIKVLFDDKSKPFQKINVRLQGSDTFEQFEQVLHILNEIDEFEKIRFKNLCYDLLVNQEFRNMIPPTCIKLDMVNISDHKDLFHVIKNSNKQIRVRQVSYFGSLTPWLMSLTAKGKRFFTKFASLKQALRSETHSIKSFKPPDEDPETVFPNLIFAAISCEVFPLRVNYHIVDRLVFHKQSFGFVPFKHNDEIQINE